MAGRMLSKENEKKLRQAQESLQSILDLLDKEEESESAETKEARKELAEAANMGNWLESRVHLGFTQIADDMFGRGQLNRDERVGVSGAIGEALNAFNAHIQANHPGLYQRSPWSDADDSNAMTERHSSMSGMIEEAATLELDYVPLVEGAVRSDGTVALKLIKPGWGSSGYYSPEVLKRDGPTVFAAGTKQYWNHATAQEEAARPEGDLNALAAELVSNARWQDGPAGPGLYADAKVFSPYQEAVNELAPHIGVSIRAMGKAQQGEAEGQKGPIITALTAAKSVDFVTEAGAGGQILQMFEAARSKAAQKSTKEVEVNEQQFKEAMGQAQAQIAHLSASLIARDAKDIVREALGKTTLPAPSQARLLESLAANPPIKDNLLDGTALLERVKNGVAAETTYLQQVGAGSSGRVEGMGQSQATQAPDQAAVSKNLAESFQRLGLNEKSAAHAAAGGW